LNSYQNLVLLQNLYRLKSAGFQYIQPFEINHTSLSANYNSFATLHNDILKCHLCDLSKSRKQSMVGFGNPQADVMIIDFYVSEMQNMNNDYFVGRSGEILKNMVENVLKLPISEIYYTHEVKCKPLNSNMPSASEFNSCKNYLFAQIKLVQPKVIVTLGEESYKNLVTNGEDFQKVRGHDIDFLATKLVPIYHPLHLLRNPELKKVTLKDLNKIKSFL